MRGCRHDIITDLSTDDEIFGRFNAEAPKILWWLRRHCGKGDIKEAHFPPEPLKVVNANTLVFEDYIAEGVVHWANRDNGDTWAAAVFHHHYYVRRKIQIPFYYWITIGSIGFMTEMTLGTPDNHHVCITAFSSHAMLRYKTRLGLGLSGFDLITHLLGRTYLNVPRVYERNGRETFEMICADGVFRAPVSGRCVFQMKTFISWDELGRRDREAARRLWNQYQEVFSK